MYEYDSTPFRGVFERDFGYLAGVARNASRFAGRPALAEAEGARTWTYAELWRDVERLAGELAARGVRPGETVVFQLFNGPEFALCWLAALRLGAIATPINFRLSAGETAHVLDDSRPAAFIFDAELGAAAREALALASHEPGWTAVVGAPGDAVAAETRFDALLASDATPPPLPDRDVYGETTRLYTSGTTGLPKGVSLNDVVEVMSAHDVIMHFPLGPDDVTLNMTPWFHRGGLYSGGPNPVFYVGAAAVVAARVRSGGGARPGRRARPHLPGRRADQPGDAGRGAAPLPPRPRQPARDRDDGGAARARGLPALPGGADAADLQRLRHHRVVLEHLPAPRRPARARRFGGARLHR